MKNVCEIGFKETGLILKWSLTKKLKLNEYYNNFLTELGVFSQNFNGSQVRFQPRYP